MSVSVVVRPMLRRRVARACSRVRPIAVRTWEGSPLPVLQAEPVEAAMPGMRSRRSVASMPGRVRLRFPGSRRCG
jgi:hypothetical protein